MIFIKTQNFMLNADRIMTITCDHEFGNVNVNYIDAHGDVRTTLCKSSELEKIGVKREDVPVIRPRRTA